MLAGTWVDYFPNGLIRAVTTYVNGEKEGLYIEIGSNNQITKRCYYHKGQRHGEYREYNYTTVKEDRTYSAAKLVGLAESFTTMAKSWRAL